jgi:predicted nucleic acid-binding Zn ribbon protein
MIFPQSLAELQESVRELGLAERLQEAEIWKVWEEVVGAAVAARTRPLRIINGTLTVAVSSAPWMQELRFMTGMMKDKLNSRLGGQFVREIALKAGKVERQKPEIHYEQSFSKILTRAQEAFIEEQSSAIFDTETRQAFIELMKASMEHPYKY